MKPFRACLLSHPHLQQTNKGDIVGTVTEGRQGVPSTATNAHADTLDRATYKVCQFALVLRINLANRLAKEEKGPEL